jgi:hypothetical protein
MFDRLPEQPSGSDFQPAQKFSTIIGLRVRFGYAAA